jgi:hypothetical protein
VSMRHVCPSRSQLTLLLQTRRSLRPSGALRTAALAHGSVCASLAPSSTAPAPAHALSRFSSLNYTSPVASCLLMPTAVLRCPVHLHTALRKVALDMRRREVLVGGALRA